MKECIDQLADLGHQTLSRPFLDETLANFARVTAPGEEEPYSLLPILRLFSPRLPPG